MDKLPFKIGDVPIQRNFDALVKTIASNISRLGVLETLGLTKRTRGVVNVSTTAAVSGSTTAVAHGLGNTPTVVLATAQNSAAGVACATVTNVGATTFDVGVRYTDGVSRTATNIVGWEAIA